MRKIFLWTVIFVCFCAAKATSAPKVKEGVEIKYHGGYCFSFKDSGGRIILTDLFDPDKTGLPVPDIKPDILLVTHDTGIKSYFEILNYPYQILRSHGGYRIMGIAFGGVNVLGNVMYAWNLGGLKIVFLGNLEKFELGGASAERFSDADIMFFPANEAAVSNREAAWNFIQKLNPAKVVFTGVSEKDSSSLKENKELRVLLDGQNTKAVFLEEGVFFAAKSRKPKFEIILLPIYGQANKLSEGDK